jgi:hypothetical protein
MTFDITDVNKGWADEFVTEHGLSPDVVERRPRLRGRSERRRKLVLQRSLTLVSIK